MARDPATINPQSAMVNGLALVQIAEAGHARGKLARRWS